jgi:peptidoglycan hydrolase-like protein with peptidoglycan-binding domain
MGDDMEKILKLGMQGSKVNQLHAALTRLGFEVAESELHECTFGDSTRQAVREFQAKHGLPDTGMVDPVTAHELAACPGSDSTACFGKYRGIVTNNKDPLQLGRLRALVPDVLGNSETGWAMPCVLVVNSLPLPPVGSGVWIEFEGGNPDYPIWSGCYWGSPDDVPPISYG